MTSNSNYLFSNSQVAQGQMSMNNCNQIIEHCDVDAGSSHLLLSANVNNISICEYEKILSSINNHPNRSNQPVLTTQQQHVPKEQHLRTPLSLLNEVCSKAKIVAQFELQEDGPIHNRRYECRVKVERQDFSWDAIGLGRTKKDAKQEAAKRLLTSMDQNIDKLLIPPVTNASPSQGSNQNIGENDPEIPGNPIGDLNELCLRIKRVPPDYEDIAETGRPHERVYTVACKLGSKFVEYGKGRSKKCAKRAAAYSMINNVRQLMKQSEVLDDDDDILDKLNTLCIGKKKSSQPKLCDVMSSIRGWNGTKLESLKVQEKPTLVTIDSLKSLKELAEEQNFKLEFVDLDIQTDEGLCQAMIALHILPSMIILKGVGGSKTQAKKNAAEEAIFLLRAAFTRK